MDFLVDRDRPARPCADFDEIESEFEPAVAANPYIQFKFRATESGPVVLTWTEDGGSTIVGEETITVV